MTDEVNPLHAVHEQVLKLLGDCGAPAEAACLDNQHASIEYFGPVGSALPAVASLAERSGWTRPDLGDGAVRLTRDGFRVQLRRGLLDGPDGTGEQV